MRSNRFQSQVTHVMVHANVEAWRAPDSCRVRIATAKGMDDSFSSLCLRVQCSTWESAAMTKINLKRRDTYPPTSPTSPHPEQPFVMKVKKPFPLLSLPVELLHEIFTYLSHPTLEDLKKCNIQLCNSVNSFSLYKHLKQTANTFLRDLAYTNLSQYFSITDLAQILRQTRCHYCPNKAWVIYLPRLLPACSRCLKDKPSLWTISRRLARNFFGMPAEKIREIPVLDIGHSGVKAVNLEDLLALVMATGDTRDGWGWESHQNKQGIVYPESIMSWGEFSLEQIAREWTWYQDRGFCTTDCVLIETIGKKRTVGPGKGKPNMLKRRLISL